MCVGLEFKCVRGPEVLEDVAGRYCGVEKSFVFKFGVTNSLRGINGVNESRCDIGVTGVANPFICARCDEK